MAGYGSKPGERRGGRQKGTPNKVSATVKGALLEALHAGDGAVAFFIGLKADDPKTFATLCGRLLPHEVTGAGGKDLIPKPQDNMTLARKTLFAMAKLLKETEKEDAGDGRHLPEK